MIPSSGDVTLGHVKSELGISQTSDLSLGSGDVRILAGKTGTQDISLGDLRGKSTGRDTKKIKVHCRYNNGDNAYGSRIGIREIQVFDFRGNEIKGKFSWTGRVFDTKKSNEVEGTYNSTIDGNWNTEYWVTNKSSGDANAHMEVVGTSSTIVRVKRIVVHWGTFKYSRDHDGSGADLYVNDSRVVYFDSKKHGKIQPKADITFND